MVIIVFWPTYLWPEFVCKRYAKRTLHILSIAWHWLYQCQWMWIVSVTFDIRMWLLQYPGSRIQDPESRKPLTAFKLSLYRCPLSIVHVHQCVMSIWLFILTLQSRVINPLLYLLQCQSLNICYYLLVGVCCWFYLIS